MSTHRAHSTAYRYRDSKDINAPPPNLKIMSNSERGKYYRRRRKYYGARLTKDVAELRNEIAALTFSRQVQRELTLSIQRTPSGAAARIVSEYCSLFCHGTPVRLAIDEQNASAALVAQATNAQRGFLTAVAAENSLSVSQVTDPPVVTTENCFDEEHLDVSITAELRVRFSRRTVEEIFPHVLGDEALTQALIGLEVAYPCVNRFRFDNINESRISALITKDHLIGDESDGRQLAVMEILEKEKLPTLRDCSSKEPLLPHSWSIKKRPREDDWVTIVSDDELSFEPSIQKLPDRLNLAYILCE
ncbi:uncharacterized protein PHALS_05486 [Plasmopara halstedii]|uniref:Uncharacterized protein n=1 Tax=Plasmopara halstedii TaxID=4781 RepID=A0A0P1B2J4_PLAHL|nr:uncharacterized protein PHALS_05486 [Plasmopara halstedii]CEG48004.1 hypothetical protein PHALS_05486 [Plasmopara halstedii]|eukprot:XP_024584373.1 hypothetical protein PHALS_05486 [Plasmopara halstedii]